MNEVTLVDMMFVMLFVGCAWFVVDLIKWRVK